MDSLESLQAIASILTDASTTIIFLWLYMREREAVRNVRLEQLADIRDTLAHERKREQHKHEQNRD